MTTDLDTQSQPSTSLAELDAAFAAKSSQQQQGTESQQQVSGEVESPNPSSQDSGTNPSSSDTQPLTKEAILSALSLEDLKSHPELSKLLQSEADKVAAVKLQGSEARLRSQINLEVATKHFASLSPEDLREELLNPEAAKMYSHVVASQSAAPDAKVQAQIDFYTRELRNTEARMRSAGLDEKTLADLHPNLHLLQAGNPDDLMDAWKSKVEDAIIETKVAKISGKKNSTDSKADELNTQANGISNSADPLITNGNRAAPRKDFMTTSGSILLADAFAEAASRRK